MQEIGAALQSLRESPQELEKYCTVIRIDSSGTSDGAGPNNQVEGK
jgi:hypothetical protein